jgi:uncharacterized protein
VKKTAGSVKFTDGEVKFLTENDMCRLGTASSKGEPHIVPVSFIWHEGHAYVVTDYKTRKLRNLRENPHAAVLVDRPSTRPGILISGPVQLIEKGEEYRDVYDMFHKRLSWVRRDPWKEGEAPFVKITPNFKASWGLGR